MIAEFKKILEEIPEDLLKTGGFQSNKDWTTEIKKRFCELAPKNYKTCATIGSSVKADYGEWLYDLCWLEYGEHNDKCKYDYLRNVILTLESEWGNTSSVIDDFHKLLQAKAQYKVMIFQSKKPDDLFEYMIKNINDYWKKDEEKYLLACYNNINNKFAFKEI